MIDSISRSKCIGCNSCVKICPKSCIDLVDDCGFLYPEIRVESCIKCDYCEKICPTINQFTLLPVKYVFAAYNFSKEALNNSSSGGIFFELARCIIINGGVVCGAAFNKDYKGVHHTIITSLEDLPSIMKSKYVQSDLRDVLKEVKELLENGIKVLFSGTPCQNGALVKYLNKAYDGLYLVDFICHGVPSQKVWRLYATKIEQIYNSEIKKVDFRNKTENWYNFNLDIELKNGQSYIGTLQKDNYMKAFLENVTLRESCYNCQYKGMERISDITLGDFWGVDKCWKGYNAMGTSILLVRSNKGMDILDKVKDNLVLESVTLSEDEIISNNSCLIHSVKKNKKREYFIKHFNSNVDIDILLKHSVNRDRTKEIMKLIKQKIKELLYR